MVFVHISQILFCIPWSSLVTVLQITFYHMRYQEKSARKCVHWKVTCHYAHAFVTIYILNTDHSSYFSVLTEDTSSIQGFTVNEL